MSCRQQRGQHCFGGIDVPVREIGESCTDRGEPVLYRSIVRPVVPSRRGVAGGFCGWPRLPGVRARGIGRVTITLGDVKLPDALGGPHYQVLSRLLPDTQSRAHLGQRDVLYEVEQHGAPRCLGQIWQSLSQLRRKLLVQEFFFRGGASAVGCHDVHQGRIVTPVSVGFVGAVIRLIQEYRFAQLGPLLRLLDGGEIQSESRTDLGVIRFGRSRNIGSIPDVRIHGVDQLEILRTEVRIHLLVVVVLHGPTGIRHSGPGKFARGNKGTGGRRDGLDGSMDEILVLFSRHCPELRRCLRNPEIFIQKPASNLPLLGRPWPSRYQVPDQTSVLFVFAQVGEFGRFPRRCVRHSLEDAGLGHRVICDATQPATHILPGRDRPPLLFREPEHGAVDRPCGQRRLLVFGRLRPGNSECPAHMLEDVESVLLAQLAERLRITLLRPLQ
ncbi:hypothetical protein [Nocardia niwae]|uniref:Uncharacterized protein n=1 Tax=Nocardia niwae TaxID=626084 RepID=A0ABV2X331_9NOCA